MSSRRGCSWMICRPSANGGEDQLICSGMADITWREGSEWDSRPLARDLVRQWAGPELVGCRIRISSRGELHNYEVVSPKPGHLNVERRYADA